MIFTRLILLALFPILTLSMRAQPPAHTAHFSPQIDDNINGFWEYLPRNYNTDVNTKYPLLIFIHGAGEQGSSQDMPTLNLVLRAGPPRLINNGNFPDSFFVGGQWLKFIVISPQIKYGISGVTSIVQPSTIEAVINYATVTYRVDATRIYLCGLSMGGGATWDYAGSNVAAAKKLAGIVVAAGAGDVSTSEAAHIAEAQLPVLATHNRNDNVITVTRTEDNIAQLMAASPALSPAPRVVYWNTGGHNVWSRTFENIDPGSSINGNLADTLGINVYEWMLQYFRPSQVLPVVWQRFEVRGQNGKALLQWTVSAQANVKEYIVEKSADGVQWTGISPVPVNAQGQYSFTDAITAVSYYRIKQVDNDGRFSYSAIKRISAAAKLLIYPNPFHNELHIEGADKLIIQLTDLTGKNVLVKKTNGNVVIDGLSTGIYHLTVHDIHGTTLYSGKVVKN